MSPTGMAGFVLLGIITGVLGGLIGIGGGIVVIPALVLLFHLTQQNAQGTSLAMMLPPIGIFAVLRYAKEGNVNFKIAALLCVGFLIGSWFGADIANKISPKAMQKVFALALMAISVRMLLK